MLAAAFLAPLAFGSAGSRADLMDRAELAFDEYHDPRAVGEILDRWVLERRAEWLRRDVEEVGEEGELRAIELGPGLALAASERRTLFLVGALDGVSRAGAEAVLSICDHMVRDRLPADLTIVAVPWPVAAAEAAGAVDEDRDGLQGEDGPDDLDGDGFVVDMLIEDVAGTLARDGSSRSPRPAEPSDVVRLTPAPEGRDDDGDGLYNEDGDERADLDSSFPIGWRAERTGSGSRLPLADPAARRLAELIFERRTVGVIVFQGNHGGLARPGGTGSVPWDVAQDAVWFDLVASWFAEAAGRSQARAWSLREARAAERPGAFIDWCYTVPGVLAVEVAPWGPLVALGEAHGAPGGRSEGRSGARPAPPSVDERERLWTRWLDDENAGLGFVPWHVVELEGGRRAWIGGWQPQTVLDPPPARLASSLEGLADFTHALVRGLPSLDVSARSERREEGLTRVSVTVINRGALPTGYATTGRHPEREPGDVALELKLEAGARLLSGEERVDLGTLAGGARSRTVEWLLFAPRGTRVTVVASSPSCATAEREVRL